MTISKATTEFLAKEAAKRKAEEARLAERRTKRMAAAATAAQATAERLAVSRNNYRVRTKPYKLLKIYRTVNNSYVDVNISLNQLGYVIGSSGDSIMETLETALRKGHGVRLHITRADGPDAPNVTYSQDVLEIPCAKYQYIYRSVGISKEELLEWGKAHGYTPIDLFYEAEACYEILSKYGEGIKKTVQILNYSRWTQTRQRECWLKIMHYNRMHGTHFFLDKKKYLLTKLDLFNEQEMDDYGLTKESIKEIIKMAPAYGLDISGIYRGYTLEYLETDEDSEDGIWVKIHDPDGKADLDYDRIAELQFCLDWLRMHNMLMPGYLMEDGKLLYEKSDAVYHGSDFEKAASSCDIDDASALIVRDSTYYEELVFDYPTETEDFVTRRRIDDNEREDEPEYMAPPDPKNLDEVIAYEAYLSKCLEWRETDYSRITTSNRNILRNTLMRVLEDPTPAPYSGKTHQIPHETVEEVQEPLSPWETHIYKTVDKKPKKSYDDVIDDIEKAIDKRSVWQFGNSWGYPNPYSGKPTYVPQKLDPASATVWSTTEHTPVVETRNPGDLRTESTRMFVYKNNVYAGKSVTTTTVETILKVLPKLPGESEKTILVDEVSDTVILHYDAAGKGCPSRSIELPFHKRKRNILKALLKYSRFAKKYRVPKKTIYLMRLRSGK